MSKRQRRPGARITLKDHEVRITRIEDKLGGVDQRPPPSTEPTPPTQTPPSGEPSPPPDTPAPPVDEWWWPGWLYPLVENLFEDANEANVFAGDVSGLAVTDRDPVPVDSEGYNLRAISGDSFLSQDNVYRPLDYAIYAEGLRNALWIDDDMEGMTGAESLSRWYGALDKVAIMNSRMELTRLTSSGGLKGTCRIHPDTDEHTRFALVSTEMIGGYVWAGGPDRGQDWRRDLYLLDELWCVGTPERPFTYTGHRGSRFELRNTTKCVVAYASLDREFVDNHDCNIRVGPHVYYDGVLQPETGP